ncbi:saccharopine dehydrogenase NADP-binding domain-containing protein [Qipengyuania psychrotolerans]|uniref:Saccharopine dehydrogenase NADP-binding domain-containing protein n=1 Tax=Qipengyuania psychrotolerans TaxID=2867238 RepID=A0ABX8ZD19_9SPHN|nr:saccharopine dehydrogenase NADP-binding domain-containing protein [Qipengyuania psychrotolerans]QZD86089.1 saccharopine dehydrogenase NADP-binding domain-containing protein [Qipengyuania psychrotolerans]
MASPLKVLIVGASGVFGSRLAELAVREEGISLTLGARNLSKLEKVAQELAGPVNLARIDRDMVKAVDLTGYDLIIDAAGPFQSSHTNLVEAAIGARVAYLDLADGREFIAHFPSFDGEAKAAGVPLVTGASSIPALSHAVLDALVAGWRAVDSVRIGIYPGNRAPRGRSVVEAILSYVGKPVRVFREGEWQNVAGWGGMHREQIAGIGPRWASVCDTPEQDLLVGRYKPRQSAEFFAGLELGLLHVGLWLCSLPVRIGILRSLRPFAGPMLAMAELLRPIGSDRGAMTVRARGADAAGDPVERCWVLRADANRGPYVPILAALAMMRRFRDGTGPNAGALVCSGLLEFADFAPDMAKLEMEHWLEGEATQLGFDSAGSALQSSAA